MRRLSPLAARLSILVVMTAAVGATDVTAAPVQATNGWSWLIERVWSWNASRSAETARARAEAALKSAGGSRILLKVDTDALRQAMLTELRDAVRRQLREARIAFAELAVRPGGVEVRIREPKDWERARSKLAGVAATLSWSESAIDVSDVQDGAVRLIPTESGFADRLSGLRSQSIEVIERRLAGTGGASSSVSPEGQDAIRILLPGSQDAERVSALLSKRARITFRLVDVSMTAEEALQGTRPPGSEIRYVLNETIPLLLRKQVALAGEDITDASAGFDQRTGEPIVSFRFNAQGTRRFAQITQENIGRPFAIVLDDDVLSAPIIREPILNGSGQISGNFTVAEASTVALLLRSGMLAGQLSVVEQQVVEPEKKAAQR